MFSTILEIMRTRHYAMEPVAFNQARQLVLHNILTHTPSGVERETSIGGALRVADGKAEPLCGQLFVGRARIIEQMADLNPDDQIVNMVRLTGTMMRSGDDCSYGSMELRDMLMDAANNPHVVAHIIYTHTPGGAADTLRDFRKAINYCHAKGQKVYMYIDGGAASGGAFLACMTDGVYAFNEKDEIGSLGMYCAFFSNKDGDEDAITKETYREFYCDRSTDKNLFYRRAAEGDMSVVAEETNAYLEQLLANAKKDRHSIKDEQLTGKMYPIGTVIGSLVDGVCTLEELALLAADEYNKRNGAALPAKEEAAAPAKSNPKPNKTDMKELTQLAAAVGAEELAHDENNGIYLNEEQAVRVEDTLAAHRETDQALAEAQAAAAEAQNALASANARIAELEVAAEEATQNSTAKAEEQARLNGRIEELEAAAVTVEEEHAAALAAATAATETAVQTAREEMQAALTEAQTALDAANAHAAEQEQTIIDLRSQVAELENSPRRVAQTAPKGNGSNPSAVASKKAFVYDPSKSATENAKALEAHNAGLKQMAQ